MNYRVGDKVDYLGMAGVVTELEAAGDYPLKVQFKDEENNLLEELFTEDGKLNKKHQKPVLKLISRPTVQKFKLYRGIFYSPEKNTYYIAPRLFKSEAEAKEYLPEQFVKLVATRPITVESLK